MNQTLTETQLIQLEDRTRQQMLIHYFQDDAFPNWGAEFVVRFLKDESPSLELTFDSTLREKVLYCIPAMQRAFEVILIVVNTDAEEAQVIDNMRLAGRVHGLDYIVLRVGGVDPEKADFTLALNAAKMGHEERHQKMREESPLESLRIAVVLFGDIGVDIGNAVIQALGYAFGDDHFSVHAYHDLGENGGMRVRNMIRGTFRLLVLPVEDGSTAIVLHLTDEALRLSDTEGEEAR